MTFRLLPLSILTISLLALGACGGGGSDEQAGPPSIRFDPPQVSANGDLSIRVGLIGYEENEVAYPSDGCLTLTVMATYNPTWREEYPLKVLTDYYDAERVHYVDETLIPSIGSGDPPTTTSHDLCEAARPGAYAVTLPGAFSYLGEWGDVCAFGELVIRVRDRGVVADQKRFDCDDVLGPVAAADVEPAEKREPDPTVAPEPPAPDPTVTPVRVENEDDYCAPLRGPDVLASELFGDDLLCGNAALTTNRLGERYVLLRYDLHEDYEPFGSTHFAVGTNCTQVDNLATGELGEAHCGFQGGDSSTRHYLGAPLPPASSGDTLRVSFWVFQVAGGDRRYGLSMDEDEWPDTVDGRDMIRNDGGTGCFWSDSDPCSFSQDVGRQAAFVYQVDFQVP